jgi:hypothetical protein
LYLHVFHRMARFGCFFIKKEIFDKEFCDIFSYFKSLKVFETSHPVNIIVKFDFSFTLTNQANKIWVTDLYVLHTERIVPNYLNSSKVQLEKSSVFGPVDFTRIEDNIDNFNRDTVYPLKVEPLMFV